MATNVETHTGGDVIRNLEGLLIGDAGLTHGTGDLIERGAERVQGIHL